MNVAIPNLKWSFLINPAYSWFENFASHFTSPDINFIPDYEDDRPTVFVLSSRHFSELTNENEVRDRATALKSILDGALYLQIGFDFRPFELEEMYDLESDKRCGYGRVSPDITANPFSSQCNNWIGQWRSHASPFGRFESSMLCLAREDEVARGMLQFLGANGCTWITLYGLLDFMKTGGMKVSQIAGITGSTEADIKRFTHTANNFAAIGPFCRHGELGHQPPSVPMRLDEAAKLLLPAARAFLQESLNKLGLKAKWELENR